jgi:hypothetical protein
MAFEEPGALKPPNQLQPETLSARHTSAALSWVTAKVFCMNYRKENFTDDVREKFLNAICNCLESVGVEKDDVFLTDMTETPGSFTIFPSGSILINHLLRGKNNRLEIWTQRLLCSIRLWSVTRQWCKPSWMH